ncbi:hypothetical protein GCM10027169_20090 [Gordonia jinhuaensis]|uniref:Uncharacterized protein n=1 Tax=Gordonia jinhuaensis TaxID=1517702 RepID=A0A916TGP4_9ACTN|nr:hypothetical protein GCM10011489_34830 [Gordonia jinhuaensis]
MASGRPASGRSGEPDPFGDRSSGCGVAPGVVAVGGVTTGPTAELLVWLLLGWLLVGSELVGWELVDSELVGWTVSDGDEVGDDDGSLVDEPAVVGTSVGVFSPPPWSPPWW